MGIGSVRSVVINGAALKVIRERSGLTQTDLAKQTGVSQGRISELESGRHPVKPQTMSALTTALAVPLAALLSAEAVPA